MHKMLNALLLAMAMLFANSAMAAIETYQFATPEMADRFEDLTAELRCPKCQNQNLSDSDSIISKDLRRQVKTMVDAGKSDDEIRTFMVQRYGDFILYDPPFKMETLVLWLAPGVLVVIGLVVVVKVRRKKPAAPVALSDEEQAQLDELIKQKKENP